MVEEVSMEVSVVLMQVAVEAAAAMVAVAGIGNPQLFLS
jgi:tetraacyldisaccharide-1-P 4'-kinase